MNDREREELLGRWIRPSSDDEGTQQERAIRMVTDAIDSSPLAHVPHKIYPKGSYANQTNVRRDSDVDISVDCFDCMYYDSHGSVVPKVQQPAYSGPWRGLVWREGVKAALAAAFATDLDVSGSVALHLPDVPGSRPNIDVVPGYFYREYHAASGSAWEDGSQVFTKDGTEIINWPDQQAANNNAKDANTGGRYKQFARALKSAENRLVEQGTIEDKPSYMMECLVYNVSDDTLYGSTLSNDFMATLQELWEGLGDVTNHDQWLEPNRLKWAFRGPKKWTVDDAREVVQGAWELLEY